MRRARPVAVAAVIARAAEADDLLAQEHLLHDVARLERPFDEPLAQKIRVAVLARARRHHQNAFRHCAFPLVSTV